MQTLSIAARRFYRSQVQRWKAELSALRVEAKRGFSNTAHASAEESREACSLEIARRVEAIERWSRK